MDELQADSRASASTAESKASSKLSTHNIQSLKDALSCNRLFIRDIEARKAYPEVVDLAQTLVRNKRRSEIDEESQQLAYEDQLYNSYANKATFVYEVWKYMHQDHRDKRISGNPGSDIDDADWTTTYWVKDELASRCDYEFRRESTPHLENLTTSLVKLLNVTPRTANPKPDLVNGIKTKAFTRAEMDIGNMHRAFLESIPGIICPFFAAEFKGANGSIQEAELQACRTGATMVNGARELSKLAGVARTDIGADQTSFAFTLAMITTNAQLYVHWTEVVPDQQTVYHMHMVGQYHLAAADTYPRIRAHLNNILDWGLSQRLAQVKEMFRRIDAKNRLLPLPPFANWRIEAQTNKIGRSGSAPQGVGDNDEEQGSAS